MANNGSVDSPLMCYRMRAIYMSTVVGRERGGQRDHCRLPRSKKAVEKRGGGALVCERLMRYGPARTYTRGYARAHTIADPVAVPSAVAAHEGVL